jgi:hypothetical protein
MPVAMIQRDTEAGATGADRHIACRTYRPLKLSSGRGCAIAAALTVAPAAATAPPTEVGQASHAVIAEEAWWTGPIVASSGGTLPQGHVLVEPYIFDARGTGSDYAGSLTYFLYGATDRLTIGLIPTMGSANSTGSDNRRRVAINDLTLTAQYRMHQAGPGELIPTWSLVIQEILPLGRFERLHDNPDKGIGGGAYATIVGVYAQRSDILASGRTIRTRLNATYTLPAGTAVRGASIFGTPEGFDGSARPGRNAFIDVSAEYSLTRSWVLACDGFFRHTASTRVSGALLSGDRVSASAPAQRSWAVAPAIEYSWSAARGVLLGVRRIFPGRATQGSWTPVFAFNSYF